MSPLQFVTAEQAKAATAHISVILHGPEKIGKSTAAASAPGPILYVNADAPSRLRYARRQHPDKDIREVRVRSRLPGEQPTACATLDEIVLHLRDGNGIATVVVDPLARVYACVLDQFGGSHPTQQNHGDAQSYMERFVLALLELPIHVVLVAHDHPYEMGTQEDGSEVRELLPYCGSISNPGLAKRLMRPVDVIAYCGVEQIKNENGDVLKDAAGNVRKRYVAQLYQGHGRRAGDGLGVLGDVRELDLTEWVAVNEAAQMNGKPEPKEK
jgi:hypothetical protein